MDKTLARQFSDIVGSSNFSTDIPDLECYSYDASGLKHVPDAVILPATTQEVSRILALAKDAGTPVVPRGAGSGTTGGSIPLRGGLVLCLTRMADIFSISTEDLMAEVEPGVVTGTLQEEASRQGLFYPPDPASLRFCTLGGNVATGAGGARAVKYGVTRDYVTALEVVLPGGEVVRTGSLTAKGVVGYDLTRLMVGAEGTLGVVTRIALKLIPEPEEVGTMIAFFPATEAAVAAVAALFEQGILPRCAEFMDRRSLKCISGELPVAVPEKTESLLLLEVDGLKESVPHQLDIALRCCASLETTGTKVAASTREAESFWKARRSLSPAITRLGFADKISEDICVPRHALASMTRRLEVVERRHGITILTFGHAGDGNLHVNLLCDLRDPKQKASLEQAVTEIMQTALELGGTISGEHGIGLTKQAYISMEIGKQGLELMQGIKKVFDPDNILNPGKVFPKCNAAIVQKENF